MGITAIYDLLATGSIWAWIAALGTICGIAAAATHWLQTDGAKLQTMRLNAKWFGNVLLYPFKLLGSAASWMLALLKLPVQIMVGLVLGFAAIIALSSLNAEGDKSVFSFSSFDPDCAAQPTDPRCKKERKKQVGPTETGSNSKRLTPAKAAPIEAAKNEAQEDDLTASELRANQIWKMLDKRPETELAGDTNGLEDTGKGVKTAVAGLNELSSAPSQDKIDASSPTTSPNLVSKEASKSTQKSAAVKDELKGHPAGQDCEKFPWMMDFEDKTVILIASDDLEGVSEQSEKSHIVL